MTTIGYSKKFWGLDFTSTTGFDTLVKRMEDGRGSCKALEHFLRLRSKCDEDYSKALMKISKGMNEFNETGTLNDSWMWMKVEMEKMGRVHMEAAQHFNEAAAKLSDFQKQMKLLRKPKEEKVSSLSKEKASYFKKVFDARRMYDQRSLEAETAETVLKKAKVNENSYPTKEWDKIVSRSTKALQECKKSEMTYKDLVTKLNEVRVNWEKEHSSFCELCESQDEERMKVTLGHMWEAANITSVTCVENDKLVESMRGALERVKVDSDMALFVAHSQTGTERPEPIQFEIYQGFSEQGTTTTTTSTTFSPAPFRGILASSQ